MGLITERDGAASGYEAVRLQLDPVVTAGWHAEVFRRHSARPSRRAVLYLHCPIDPIVTEDLANWYTERGFHFYLADLRPGLRLDRPARSPRQRRELEACFAGIDLACSHLREADGIDALIVSAHGTGALAAALWCDARGARCPADALVLSAPAFGRRLRRGLDIPCPVLVLSPAAGPPGRQAGARHQAPGDRGRILPGSHVTWLQLDEPLAGDLASGQDHRRYFDELGRWLGAYMYGQVRDQLL